MALTADSAGANVTSTSSPLLGVAAQARAAESRPWTLPAVQGLLTAAEANITQLDRTYEFRLKRSSGEFDGRTLVNDRHRGAGT